MGEDRAARLALNAVVEPGDLALAKLLERYQPEEIWELVQRGHGPAPWVRRAAGWVPGRVEERAQRHRLRFIVPGDPTWPGGLEALAACEVGGMGGAPLGLWLAGAVDLAGLMASSVALVGSRASTAYGERVASEWAAELSDAGTTVVSGGAYGIDAAAHRGSLAEGGPTVAVLAHGLDAVYPKGNDALFRRVREAGGLVSEYPPGEHPTRMRFLARNRLIAALTRCTVVVEAAARSGARNTASWALACGRPVAAVPGPVGNAQSFTPHRLIRDGEATLVATLDQVRELIAPLGGDWDPRPAQPRLLDTLEPGERAVYEALPSRGGRAAGELSLASGLPLPSTLAALGALEAAGLVARRGDGRWGLGPVENRPIASPHQDDA